MPASRARSPSSAIPARREAVALMIELAVDGLYRAEFDAMRGWATRAAEAAAPLGDRALVAGVLGMRAVAGALEAPSPRREPIATRRRS